MQDAEKEFVNSKVFPSVPSMKASDVFYTYPKGAWFRSDAQVRLPGTESAGTGYTLSTDSFNCEPPIAVHVDVDDARRANSDAVLQLDSEAGEKVAQDLALKKEIDWMSTFFTTSVWTGSTTGSDITVGTLWDAAGSTPIADMAAQIDSLKAKTGYKGNTVVLAENVWEILKNHADLLDRLKITSDKIVTVDLLARVLEVDRVLIAGGIQNTAKEGQTPVLTPLATKDVLIAYAAPRPGRYQPSAGYTFTWTGFLGAARNGIRVKKFRMEHLESDRIEGEMAYDQKLVAADMGAFLNNVIS